MRRAAFSEPPYLYLRELLGPTIGLLFELRFDSDFPSRVQARLKAINLQIIDLVTDDEIGLIGASPEERVSLAVAMWEERYG